MENMGIAEVFEFIDEGEFKKAGFICLDLVKREPENAAVYVAMLMIEMQARNANQIKANLHMYVDSDNYKNAVKYDDGKFSEILKIGKREAKKLRKKKKKGVAVIALALIIGLLTAGYLYIIPAVIYYRADKYHSESEYLKACEIFSSLGDYKDSFEKIGVSAAEYARKLYESGEAVFALEELERLCTAGMDEIVEIRYDCAMYAMNNLHYIEAASAFVLLGDYKDSEQKLYNCHLYNACYLSDNGNRDGAIKALAKIELDEEDIFDMKYNHGGFLFDHQLYYDAKLHYALLGDYRDSIDKIVYIDGVIGETEYTVTENPDDEGAAKGVFVDYREAFEFLLENEGCHIYDDKGIMYY